MNIEFPTPESRLAIRRPPLAALVWAICKSDPSLPFNEQSLTSPCKTDAPGSGPISFARIRMAEQNIPPALATAWARASMFATSDGLGLQVRRFGLLPGGAGERFLQSFAKNPPGESAQDAWERWAAGLMQINGMDLDDASLASALLLPIRIGCRPSPLNGKKAAMWKRCWEKSPVSPPPYWTSNQETDHVQ